METLEGGVRKLQKFLVAVAEGSDSALSVLSSLGLTLADLSRLTPDKQFEFILRPKLCLGRNIPEALLRRVPNDSDIGDDQFVRE